MCAATAQLDTFLKILAKYPACAQKIDDVKVVHVCAHDIILCCCVHHGLHK